METDIRQKLHQFIDAIEDKKVAAMYALFEDEIDTDTSRRKLVQAERQKYLTGEGSSFSWDEVKEMATNKKQRSTINMLI